MVSLMPALSVAEGLQSLAWVHGSGGDLRRTQSTARRGWLLRLTGNAMRPEHAETALSTPNIDRHKLAAAFIQSLDKLMRGMRLYKGEGPLVEKLLAVCVAAAHPLLDGGEITFRVAPFGLALDGVKITEDDDQLAKALFRFFGDGVRELAILPGLEPAEIVGLATVLRTEPKAGEDDMTTLLWKQQFAHIRHYATDTFQAGPSVDESIDSTLAGNDNDASINED